MRPRFALELPGSSDDVWAAVEAALQAPDVACSGWVQDGAAELHIRPGEEHFFSPMLNLWTERGEEGQTILRGRFGPHPHVWMLFMAIYFVLGAVAVGGLMYGISQWILGQSPWALGFVPAGLGLGAFTYGATFIGQGLGAEQTHGLWSVVDEVRHRLEAQLDPPL